MYKPKEHTKNLRINKKEQKGTKQKPKKGPNKNTKKDQIKTKKEPKKNYKKEH